MPYNKRLRYDKGVILTTGDKVLEELAAAQAARQRAEREELLKTHEYDPETDSYFPRKPEEPLW